MKVRCVKFIDEQTGQTLDSNSWLSVGKEYRVLSIYMQHGLPMKFQLIGDDGETPAYHAANQFEIVTNIIPSTWVVDFESDSYFKLTPRNWCNVGFWEDYFDGVPEAVDLFDSEKAIITKEDP